MIEVMRWLAILIRAALSERRDLPLENLALRQQLGVLNRRNGVPRLKKGDRLFWVVLSRIWAPGRQALHMVVNRFSKVLLTPEAQRSVDDRR
jgi:hypothetical protein